MKAKNIFTTLASLGYSLAVLSQTPLVGAPASAPVDQEVDVNTRCLEAAVDKLTRQVKVQNNFWNRLVLGLATGVGTAIGASVIATLVLLILGPIFKAVGIDIDFPGRA
jgi:hypothetical protein